VSNGTRPRHLVHSRGCCRGLNPGKTVKRITLPSNGKPKVLAMSLV
jgi:hypothetical protein